MAAQLLPMPYSREYLHCPKRTLNEERNLLVKTEIQNCTKKVLCPSGIGPYKIFKRKIHRAINSGHDLLYHAVQFHNLHRANMKIGIL